MKQQQPPKLAERFLLFFLKEELVEEVLGDLDEKFFRTLERKSLTKARRNYWYQVFNYLRPFAFKYIRSNSIFITMIKSNFKISYRILVKNKMYSAINIGGLAIGMSLFILIALWIQDELSFNQNHQHYDRVVQVMRVDDEYGKVYVNSSQVSRLGVYLGETYPTIFEHVATTFYRNQEQFLRVGDRSVERLGYFFSKDISEVLSLDFVAGKSFSSDPLDEILLSNSLAKTLFPDGSPIGEPVRINNSRDLLVSGVYEDLPKNSTFYEMEYIVPMELVYNKENPATWSNQNTRIYGLLREGIQLEQANEIIKNALADNMADDDRETTIFLHPMKDWHLNSTFEDGVQVTGSEIQEIKIYGATGLFVLLLAFINFINLNTARCNNRLKEIGIRKSIGTYKSQLIQQFLSESFLYAFASMIISLTIILFSLDWFNEISGKEMSMPWSSVNFWVLIATFLLLTTLFSGAYPALFLSSFDPIVALRGDFKQGVLSARFRQILVVFQFTISIALIIGTITVYNQLSFGKARPVGYNQSDLITMRGRSAEWDEKYDVLREELKKTGYVVEMASANYPLTNDLGNNDGFRNPETNEEYPITFNTILVNPEYGSTTQWELIAGRDFSRTGEDERNNIIIGESAVAQMGLSDPIGKMVKAPRSFFGRGEDFKIVGVVRDMVKHSPFEEITPLMVFSTEFPLSFVFIRLKEDTDYLESLTAMQETFEKVIPGYPLNYDFIDDAYQVKFQSEERIGSLAILFSVLAILISCLGLFGLSAFVVEQRTKEIGIRKVLGASVIHIWNLISKDFSLLVLLACIFSMPITSYLLNQWLESYEYRISIGWSVYLVAAIICFIISLATVSIHSLKSALGNPVESLRAE